MSNPVPVCVHVKADGIRCGSPAVSGTELCYHHSTVKKQLGKWKPADQVPYGEFTPIPYIFPEDRTSLQVDYFLLFQAVNEERVERRAAELMFRMLREMGRNLGKSGSLVESSDQRSAVSDQNSDQGTGHRAQESSGDAVSDQNSDQGSGHRAQETSKEAVSVKASAVEISAGPIAPESCFSTKPATRNIWDIRRELFRKCSLHPSGQRVLNLYFKPVEREEWRTDSRKFRGY